MKKVVLFLIFIINFINCLPENTVNTTINDNNSTYSDGMPLTFQQNVESSNINNNNENDPGVFSPMEDFDEEAIDAYCVDISNDCEEREHFCQNPAFHETMLERCPRTCNLCKELISRRTVPSPTINSGEEEEDYTFPDLPPAPLPQTSKPTTMFSTLPPPTLSPESPESHESTPSISLTQLVGSAENHIIDIESAAAMDKATTAPNTSRRTKKLRARRICRDLASDCGTKLRLCSSTFYSAIMEKFCQKSCNFCNEKNTFKKHKIINRPDPYSSRPSPKNRTKVRQTSSTCLDVGIDCIEKRTLCSHKSYTNLMQRMCPSTCNMCDTL
uniref:ShKT domain-containing protein n=1 Tax=Panagrolaimus superbus TaxID=310955 RepID=A0A914Y0J7_9BILA